jgi:hypothetical protein
MGAVMNDLATRIAEQLHAALDRNVGAEISVRHAERGLAEVARIAARVVRDAPA